MSDDQFHTLQAQFREINRRIREGFSTVNQRLDGVEKRLDGMRDAILYMADHGAGSVPGTDSHIKKGVRRRMVAGER